MRANRKHMIAAVVATAAVACGLIAWSVSPGHDDQSRAGQASRPGTSRPGTSRTVPSSSADVVSPSPVVDFSSVRWVSYHGVRLPVSAQAGPRETDDGLASGYADTPLGALLAMVNIGVRTSWELGPAIFQPTIQQQVTGPFETAMLSADLDQWGQGGSQEPDSGADAAEVAYLWAGYTPSAATADIVTEGTSSDGAVIYAVTQIQVQWQAGDWRVVAPPGGNWGSDATQIPSLNGYLMFPGQEG
jgi:hypothetical protein